MAVKPVPAGVPLEFRVWQEKGKFIQEVQLDGQPAKWKSGRMKITLQPGENAVPLVIDTDYGGRQVEVRAIDPRTGAILDRLTLKDDRMV